MADAHHKIVLRTHQGRPMYKVLDDDNTPIDASFSVNDGCVFFHSRGGTLNSASARNTEYALGLRLLLSRISESPFEISEVMVETTRTSDLPQSERIILSEKDASLGPDELFTLISRRMSSVGQKRGSKGGNQTRQLKLRFKQATTETEIVERLKGTPAEVEPNGRLKHELLNRVTEEHIFEALQALKADTAPSAFSEPTKYLVALEDGTTLPPKAVFGKALSIALEMEIFPHHFSGGISSICMKTLSASGLKVVSKEDGHPSSNATLNAEDQTWTEGSIRRVTHLVRERNDGAPNAKKAQFRRLHGRLFCERCGIDPLDIYGEFGEACIEVHHVVPLANATRSSTTRLEDLQCLCANCHRIVHRELKG